MTKKIILGIIFSLTVIGIFFYLDPLEKNRTFYENIERILIRDKDDPLQAAQRIVGRADSPEVFDPSFTVEEFVLGLDRPTTIGFVGQELLILEKNYGKVRLVKNGILQEKPVLDVEVSNGIERGLLGITTIDSEVYLYYTHSEHDGDKATGNRIYKYIWDGKELKDPILLNILPSFSTMHNGGAMTSDLSGNVFAVIGDGTSTGSPLSDYRILQNIQAGEVDDTSVIIRVGLNTSEIVPSMSQNPFAHYYANGIRNSFGLAVDPITGNLWDTENGFTDFDEINLVQPKFNSGWIITMGPASEDEQAKIPKIDEFTYSDPEFSWEKQVAPTGLVFANSDQFKEYKNTLFVGDCNLGNVYKFTLNENRTSFIFNDPNLKDLVANTITLDDGTIGSESMQEILFATGFGCITDLEFGPDGLLYVVSIENSAIYRILPQ